MITLNFAHLCEMAFLSQNGNLNLIGIFEKVYAPQFPATFSRLSLVTSIKSEAGDHTNTLKIVNVKSGEEIMKPISINLNMKESGNDIRLIGDINNLTIKDPGKYRVEIYFNNEKIYEIPFSVEKTSKPIPENR